MCAIVKRDGTYIIIRKGLAIGEVFRMHKNLGFGIKLIGYYWQGEKLNKKGGATTKRIKRLKDVCAYVESALKELESQL
jgi:hypothetical protein